MKHLVIADTQVKPGYKLDYLTHIGKYIVAKKPDVVVHIGDHYDFPSLSSYDKGKLSFEGRRVKADLDAGDAGVVALLAPLRALQAKQRQDRKKVYTPRLVFTLGNHEDRFDRLAEENPELDGLVGTATLKLKDFGFEVHPYLKPVNIDGINYVHFLANPFTGKPYGGTALNQLKNVGMSFVVGHKQTLDVAIRPTLDGRMQIGIVNGACYPHDEGYKGYQGNFHFRGLTLLHEVEDGFGNPCFVSLKYLEKRFG